MKHIYLLWLQFHSCVHKHFLFLSQLICYKDFVYEDHLPAAHRNRAYWFWKGTSCTQDPFSNVITIIAVKGRAQINYY